MNNKRNYNVMALRGATDIDDMDVCNTLNLNPQLAYTPAINDAAINAMYKQNYDGWIKKGLKESDALARADEAASAARKEISERLKT